MEGSGDVNVRHFDQGKEMLVGVVLEGLCKTVGSHFGTSDMSYFHFAKLDRLADPFVMDIDMLCTFIVAVRVSKLNCGEAVAIELGR